MTENPSLDDVVTAPDATGRPLRPGWPEIVVALICALVIYSGGITLLVVFPAGTPAAEGIAQLAFSGLAPIAAFLITMLVRIRGFAAFGIRRVDPRWLLVAAGLAVGCLAIILTFDSVVAYLFPGVDDSQGTVRAASSAGVLALAGTLLFGGLITPLGEELLFRGVFARFLQRWGTWVAVLASALVFALWHGINLVFPSAFLVGLCCGWLLVRTGSIWPGVVLHVIYNTTFLVIYSF